MTARRSPTAFHQVLPYAKLNGAYAAHAASHMPRSRLVRWVRLLLPMLCVAVTSSYITYLLLYQPPRPLHAAAAGAGAAGAEHPSRLDGWAASGQAGEAAAGAAGAVRPLGDPVAVAAAAAAIADAAAAAAQAAGAHPPAPGAAAGGGAEAGPAAAAHTVGEPAGAPQAQQHVPGQPPPLAPTDAALRWARATGRRMSVALVNEAPYHLEIVAGFLHVLSQLPVEVTWYQAGQQGSPSYTAVELLATQGFPQLLGFLPRMRPSSEAPEPCDFAIFISPEYFEKETRAFLKAAKPITAVILGHNGMNSALQRIQGFHPRLHFAALAPHVAAASRQVLHIHTHWMMAVFPFAPKKPCSLQADPSGACMNGFSIQGNFESQRRNYTHLWTQMEAARVAGQLPTHPPAKPFHLHLVGRGDVKNLGMPGTLSNMTTIHFNLRFPEYYDTVHHTNALLMILGSRNYLLQKMSSTIVSSLMTGVPIIADDKVLASYTFVKPEHVHLMGPGESEMDVMQRVLRMPPADVFAVRQRVVQLAEHLNRRTTQVLQTFMPFAEDAAFAPPVVPVV